MRKVLTALAFASLAVLFWVHSKIQIQVDGDPTWLIHVGAGFFVAMFWWNFWLCDVPGWRCLIVILSSAIAWELYEYGPGWFRGIPAASLYDVIWTVVGGVIYNTAHFLVVRWCALKCAIGARVCQRKSNSHQ